MASSSFNEYNVPLRLRNEFFRFIDHGKTPSDFLYAVLCNDLLAAAEYADYDQKTSMVDIVLWVNENAPDDSCGSESRVIRYLEQHTGPRFVV